MQKRSPKIRHRKIPKVHRRKRRIEMQVKTTQKNTSGSESHAAAKQSGKKQQTVDMTHGPLTGKILLFTLPIMLSSILQLL